MKDLYIIQGSHFVPTSETEGSLYQVTLQVQTASREIARELILREGIENLFKDSVDVDYANLLNSHLQIKKKPKISQQPFVEQTFAWIRMLQDCRKQGTNISYTETETPELVERISRLIKDPEGTHPYGAIINWSVRNNPGKVTRKFLRIERDQDLGEALLYLRDMEVFRHVKEKRADNSLLWMGIDHPLEEFYKRKSGFRVATVRLEDDLNYEIRLANRDMPEYLPGLVERVVGEVKQKREVEDPSLAA